MQSPPDIVEDDPPAASGRVGMPGSESELWRRLRESNDLQARDQLIELHLDYARVVAASYYGRRMHNDIEFAEYHQLAALGLIESIDRYDPVRGAQFRTFAARRMHGAILNGLERLTEKQQQIAVRTRLRKERLNSIKEQAMQAKGDPVVEAGKFDKHHAEELFRYLAEVGIGIALSKLLEDSGMLADPARDSIQVDGHYQAVELKQLRRRVRELIGQLSHQEQTVIASHYLHEHAFADIAAHLGVTCGRVSQIHRRALQTMRGLLKAGRRCDVAW